MKNPYPLEESQLTALIDADVIVYRSCFAVQEDAVDWGDFDGDPGDDARMIEMAMEVCEDIVNQWTDISCADEHLLCFSDRKRETFRFKLFPEYKANRADREKPTFLDAVDQKLREEYPSVCFDGLEGDDTMGIIHTLNQDCSIIVSIDKDMKTIPGLVLAPKPEKTDAGVLWDGAVMEIDELEADWWWMFQTLTGDSTDGFKGAYRVGPVKAKKILGEPGVNNRRVLWKRVVETFIECGQTRREAVLNARMARILRKEDYTFRTKRIKLFPGGALKKEDYLE